MIKPIKILLVDDVAQNLVALDALLSRPGVEALQARSGAEALELLLENDIALALLDVQMPEMDGFELAELMRGSPRTRNVPIIFLTATDRDKIRTFRGYEAGAVDFLYKPFDPHILRSKVEVFVQLQSQKLQLAEQLETVSQMVRTNEMFIAVLGHDLRNPLSSVMASAEALYLISDPERVKAAASRIKSSGTRMAKMIEQLLDVARMRSGQLTISPAEADIASVCQAIMNEFDAVDDTRRLSRRCKGDTKGFWDIDRLGQIMSNLIGNALRHGDPSAPVFIEVDGERPHELHISVANAGEIPAALRPHLFRPFTAPVASPDPVTETSAAAKPHQGLGLGLFIAHELVRLHGGRLTMTSTADIGTIFEIKLPRHTPLRVTSGSDLWRREKMAGQSVL